MNNKKNVVEGTTVTRDLSSLSEPTGNLYESISVIAKRSNQLATEIKDELSNKLSEFTSNSDNLEEIFENREQIEISRHYEKMPKPTLIAISEFLDDKIHHEKRE
jgi:DNA-directed RNA polymerase subunit K/omega